MINLDLKDEGKKKSKAGVILIKEMRVRSTRLQAYGKDMQHDVTTVVRL